MNKFKLPLITLVIMMFICTSISYGSNEYIVNVSIDGDLIEFDRDYGYPFIDDNNRTMIPVRKVMEILNTNVSWKNGKATISNNFTNVEITPNKDIIMVNNKEVKLDTNAIVLEGRIYIPIKYVAEAFGNKVIWDTSNGNNVVILNSGYSDSMLLSNEFNYKVTGVDNHGIIYLDNGGEKLGVKLIGIETEKEFINYVVNNLNGKYVAIETDKLKKDDEGNDLVYLYKEDLLINAEVCKRGYAKPYIELPNVKHIESITNSLSI